MSALLVFVAVPLTLNHLGTERYGLWVTLFSVFAWLSLTDLGLSNGLLNALSEAYGKKRRDLAREYVSVAFWGLSLLAILVGGTVFSVSSLVDWASVFRITKTGLSAEFAYAVLAGIILFMMAMPLTILNKVYIAHQRGEIANAWAAATSLGGFLGLVTAVHLDGPLPALVIGFLGGQLSVSILNALWLFFRTYPELRPTTTFSRSSYQRVFHVGIAFFVTQLATLMLFQSGNIIISNKLGPSHVPPFQVTWLLFSYVLLPQQMVGSYIWAAVGEAYAKGDVRWMRTLYWRYSFLSVVFALTMILPLTVFYEVIIINWAGPDALPTLGLVYWMAAWVFVLTLISPSIAILGGTGRLRAYSLFSVFAATIAVLGAFWAVEHYGVVGVMVSITLSVVAIAMIPALYLTREILKDSALPAADQVHE